jgi:phage baseplate assembly protein W
MALTYRGFNTIDQYKKFRLTNLDLIKRDLLNHFQIRKGEKLMNPDFGSIVWNTLFEPLTEETKRIVLDDVKKVVGYDPRIRVNEVVIDDRDYGLQIEISLTYLPDSTLASIEFFLNKETKTLNVV